ncbi:hypothetical protein QUF49_12100 [Fictibacillus sp. b24]|uniref:CsxC family protein n=1 Tax=Fictibacillus sp. b24 TaxID=3055863 RepID=UPI0025A02424|nr:hypothetical protein [Fictibacillus sp. b24]MDM5316740.1 hypothetical protein [Fictibacillus sp. b24]
MSVNPFPRTTSMNVCKAIIDADPTDGTIITVPVLLQKFTVQIPMHAKIEFPKGEEVLEIKQIKKKVFITQCRLVQPKGSTTSGNLFLSGFVRKNIQYAANPKVDCAKEILSTIKSLTVDVPFDCVVQIESFRSPAVGPFLDTRDEFGYFTSQPLGKGFPEKDRLLSNDQSQFHQHSTEHFNELPFCEIVRSDIIEIDEFIEHKSHIEHIPFEKECRIIKCIKCRKTPCRWCNNQSNKGVKPSSLFANDSFFADIFTKPAKCPDCSQDKPKKCEKCVKCMCKKCNSKPLTRECTFTELSEKMVLDLTLKLLQKQQVLLDMLCN